MIISRIMSIRLWKQIKLTTKKLKYFRKLDLSKVRAMCPINPINLLHDAYYREHICIFSVFNQCINSGFLGLLCPVSKWYFPVVHSSSNGLSVSDRVLVGLPFLHSNKILSLPLKPSPHVVRNPRPHAEATCRYYGDSPS